MRRLFPVLTGLLTTVVFLIIGGTLLAEGYLIIGGVLTALGAFRGVVWVRQSVAAFRTSED